MLSLLFLSRKRFVIDIFFQGGTVKIITHTYNMYRASSLRLALTQRVGGCEEYLRGARGWESISEQIV